nr:TATA box-binding protein-associated factor chain TAFII 90 [Cryptomonas sp.]
MLTFKTCILFNCLEYLIKRKKILALSSTLKISRNTVRIKKNFNQNQDPIYVIRTYVHIKNWILGFSDFYKDYLFKIISPLALLIFFKFLKKKFYSEAKLFFVIFDLKYNLTNNSWFKILQPDFNFLDLERKKTDPFSSKKKISIKLPISCFNILIRFFEGNGYVHFLEYINKHFLVILIPDFCKKIKDLKKKENKFKSNNKIEDFSKTNIKIPIYNKPEKIKSYKILKIVGVNINSINSISISPDENTIVSGLDDSNIRIFDFVNEPKKNHNFSLVGHSASISSIKISSCNNFVISSSTDGEIKLWSLRYKKLLVNFENFNKPIWNVCFSARNNLFSTACGDSVSSLWIPERLFPIRFFIGHKLDVNVTKWNSLGNIMATGSDDRTVRVWDIKSAKTIAIYKNFNAPVYNLEFSPDGHEICVSGLTKYIEIWDLRANKILTKLHDNKYTKIIKNIAYSLNGQIMIYNTSGNIFRVLSRKFLHNKNPKQFAKERYVHVSSNKVNLKKIYEIKCNSDQRITLVGV